MFETKDVAKASTSDLEAEINPNLSHEWTTQENDDKSLLPPDGGYGWVCVLAQFLINGFTWGVVQGYSVYLAYYLSHDIFPEARPIDYAFIGGFNFAFALLVPPLATLLTRPYGVKIPMVLGTVLLTAGLVSASFATKIWHLYLSQGICLGTGVGFIYFPSTSIIPQWFSEKRSLANGICASGSGIGALIICFTTQALLGSVGLAWALRITALGVFVINLIATILIRSRDEDIKPSLNMFNFKLLGLYQLKLLLGWSFILMFGYIALAFSLSDYTLAIGRSHEDSATVAAILNLGAAIGRPFMGFLSDRYGRVRVTAIATFTCGTLIFTLWLLTTNYVVLIIFALVSGSIWGIFWIAMVPLAADIVGLKQLPSFLNIVWLSVVVPSAFGEVIVLELRHQDFGARSYIYAQAFTGVSYIAASMLLFELWRMQKVVGNLA
ncbi:MFS transporter, MCP family, solute carrier family 16, member 6 [Xylaria sp. FL0933]|nr:MFS transporter, MCP family, solute carrier family 16, member 6 [Xylaria sp. FL0933]